MAIKKEDLLGLVKAVEFKVVKIEDDSSRDDVTGELREVKIMTVTEAVTASSSVPFQGKPLNMKDNRIYVAQENITAMLEGMSKNDDGTLDYKGTMFLDVSKPSGRINNRTGQYEILKPAKIWLTQVKFSKLGNTSRVAAQTGLQTAVSQLFAGGMFDATAPITPTTGQGNNTGGQGNEEKKDPQVVENKAKGNGTRVQQPAIQP